MALRDTGFLAMHAPEDLGGAGASALDVALVAEQLALAAVPGPVRRRRRCSAPELLALVGLADLVAEVAAGSLRVASRWTRISNGIARVGEPCVAWDSAHATHALLLDDAGRLCWCEIVR